MPPPETTTHFPSFTCLSHRVMENLIRDAYSSLFIVLHNKKCVFLLCCTVVQTWKTHTAEQLDFRVFAEQHVWAGPGSGVCVCDKGFNILTH